MLHSYIHAIYIEIYVIIILVLSLWGWRRKINKGNVKCYDNERLTKMKEVIGPKFADVITFTQNKSLLEVL